MRGSVGEQQVRRRRRVRGRRARGRLAPRHEVRRGVRGRRQRARRQLLLHRALLDVVAELGGRHAVRTFAACLELGAAKLGLRERRRREGEGLRAEGRGRGESGGRGGRRRRGRLHRPEALRLRVERTSHLKRDHTLILHVLRMNPRKSKTSLHIKYLSEEESIQLELYIFGSNG